MITVSSEFSSGSIDIISLSDPNNIRLKLKKDRHSDLMQWFYFSIHTDPKKNLKIHLCHLKESSYPEGWQNYRVLISYDREEWLRIPTDFDGDTLTFSCTPQHETIYFAYATPYTYERHLDFLAKVQSSSRCHVGIVGKSVEGRDLHLLTIGEPGKDKKKCWFVGRQHCGETMAEWCLQGLIEKLLDKNDNVSTQLLKKAVFYVMPNLNPDGTALGHQRMNALGIDLNREWLEPDENKSPEIFFTRHIIHKTGADFFIDVHGDENIPYVFLAARSLDERIEKIRDRFRASLLTVSTEFQREHGYVAAPGSPINTKIAANYIGSILQIPSFTLELPFKDNDLRPDPRYGWSHWRSIKLGRDLIQALDQVVADL